MKRRAFLSSLACLSCLAIGSTASAFAATMGEAAVRFIYEREVGDHNARARASEDAFLATFTRSTQEAWRAARQGPGPSTAGPVTNAFFGPVLPGWHVALVDVTTLSQGPDYALARVSLVVRGAPTHVDVSAKLVEGRHWRIEYIRYENGSSFLGSLRAASGGLR